MSGKSAPRLCTPARWRPLPRRLRPRKVSRGIALSAIENEEHWTSEYSDYASWFVADVPKELWANPKWERYQDDSAPAYGEADAGRDMLIGSEHSIRRQIANPVHPEMLAWSQECLRTLLLLKAQPTVSEAKYQAWLKTCE